MPYKGITHNIIFETLHRYNHRTKRWHKVEKVGIAPVVRGRPDQARKYIVRGNDTVRNRQLVLKEARSVMKDGGAITCIYL